MINKMKRQRNYPNIYRINVLGFYTIFAQGVGKEIFDKRKNPTSYTYGEKGERTAVTGLLRVRL